MKRIVTGSQTVGPFYHYGLIHDDMRRRPVHGAANEEVRIAGRVVDGAGQPTPDVMLEFWHPSSGFARITCDPDGRFALSLPRPKADEGGGAPYFSVLVFGRGMLRHQHTRCYLPGGPGLDGDPVLAKVPADRRATLIARAGGDALGFDIVLQGDGETVFFAI